MHYGVLLNNNYLFQLPHAWSNNYIMEKDARMLEDRSKAHYSKTIQGGGSESGCKFSLTETFRHLQWYGIIILGSRGYHRFCRTQYETVLPINLLSWNLFFVFISMYRYTFLCIFE